MRAQTAEKIGWNRTGNEWNWAENEWKLDGTCWKIEMKQYVKPKNSWFIQDKIAQKLLCPPNSFRKVKVNYVCYNNFFWHPDTQQALPSKRVASWRNFVKNDTYTVAADASQVLITRRFLLQNEMCGWVSKLVPRLRISESHFVADFHNGHLFVVYPKIDIVWHSTDDIVMGRVRINHH